MMFTPVATIAGSEHTYQEGYSTTKTCYRSEYREEYVPGDEDDPGYVRIFLGEPYITSQSYP